MRTLLSAIIITSCIVFVSCVTVQTTSRPSWVQNSAVSGKVAGVGICGMHVNGKNAQRALAIKRAIDEIALQMGVTVNNVALIGTVANKGGSSSSLESYSFQTVDGKVVKAVIRDTWEDPQTEELYVWMVAQ